MRRRHLTFQFSPFSFQFNEREPNFLSEGVRFVLSQTKKFRDSTRSTALNFLVWDGTKMCPLSQEIFNYRSISLK